jgi:hypothetical protein
MENATLTPLDIGTLISTVQKNCDISDAQHAGDLTLCTFLLKMRELYRWEHDIPLSQDMPTAEVGNWMNARGQLWEGIETAPFEPLPLPGGTADPFAVNAVNRQLAPQGLVYSGGYGRFCKPHFFLGRLLREEERNGHQIFVSACEYARDLDAPPGMMLDGTIFVRTEALRRWLWERYEEWRWNRRNEAMGRAVDSYGFERDTETALQAMTESETESVILHELGEAIAGEELGTAWESLLGDLMRSRGEIMARAVRDLYADCATTLPGLLERQNPAAIHFYFANLVGMRRKLFPELAARYREWLENGSLAGLERAAGNGREHWRNLACEMLELHTRLGEKAGERIERLIESDAALM